MKEMPERIYLFDCNDAMTTPLEGDTEYIRKDIVDDIEREVKEDAGGYPYIDATELYDYVNDKPLAKAGDRVKVVFIKDK